MTTATVATTLPVPSQIGSIDAYISVVNQVPLLTVEQEQSLARSYRDDSDLESARGLVMAHLRFVVHVARSYSGYGLQLGDLIQEGNIGLMKAVKRFDPDQGVRLVSFAVHWIRAEMHEFILRNWRIVKVATTKAQRKLFFNLRKNKKRLGWFTHAEAHAVAKDLGVPPEVVVEMESRLTGQDIGFDAPTDENEDSPVSPTNFLPTAELDPETAYERSDWKDHHTTMLYQGLNKLDARSQDIIARRWLSDNKVTLQELADEYSVSAERIRQLEANALKKMKAMIAA